MMLLAASVLGSFCAAAEYEKTITLNYGMELHGRVVGRKNEDVLVDVGGPVITIPSKTIRSIGPYTGSARKEPDSTVSPSGATGMHGSWMLTAYATWGRHDGSINGDGEFANAGVRSALHSELSFNQMDPLPGMAIDLEHVTPTGALRYGLRIGTGSAAGDSATAQWLDLVAVAGLVGRPAANWETSVGVQAGWSIATAERSLAFHDSMGTLLDQTTTSDELSGWTVGLESAVLRRIDGWSLGAVAGLDLRGLAGSSSWTSSSGAFTGHEDLTADLVGVYAGLSAGRSW